MMRGGAGLWGRRMGERESGTEKGDGLGKGEERLGKEMGGGEVVGVSDSDRERGEEDISIQESSGHASAQRSEGLLSEGGWGCDGSMR